MNSRISADSASFRYGTHEVLRDVSFQVHPGELFCIIGANGAGKTTLLRLLTGTLRPHRGRVLLDGDDIHSLDPSLAARRLSFVPQLRTYVFPLTVRSMVMLGRYPYGRRFEFEDGIDRAAVQTALELLSLDSLADRSVTELSGGEQHRVAIARAVAQQTPLMLLDEPTAHFDIRHQLELFDLLRQLCRTQGRTIVCVTHDVNLAAMYSDRLAVLADATLAACGTPSEILTVETVRRAYGTAVQIASDPAGFTRVLLSPTARFISPDSTC